ncbi:MAG: hypothetical protein ACYSR8_04515, partial [Planctomycetota bacterium]
FEADQKLAVQSQQITKAVAIAASEAQTRVEAEEMVKRETEARIRAEQAAKQQLDEKTRAYEETIAKTEETLKAESEEISKIKAELGIKMMRIKADANNIIAQEQIKRKELEKQAGKLKDKSDRGIATIKFESDQEELARSKTITQATI